jgi:hypothetical protein
MGPFVTKGNAVIKVTHEGMSKFKREREDFKGR